MGVLAAAVGEVAHLPRVAQFEPLLELRPPGRAIARRSPTRRIPGVWPCRQLGVQLVRWARRPIIGGAGRGRAAERFAAPLLGAVHAAARNPSRGCPNGQDFVLHHPDASSTKELTLPRSRMHRGYRPHGEWRCLARDDRPFCTSPEQNTIQTRPLFELKARLRGVTFPASDVPSPSTRRPAAGRSARGAPSLELQPDVVRHFTNLSTQHERRYAFIRFVVYDEVQPYATSVWRACRASSTSTRTRATTPLPDARTAAHPGRDSRRNAGLLAATATGCRLHGEFTRASSWPTSAATRCPAQDRCKRSSKRQWN